MEVNAFGKGLEKIGGIPFYHGNSIRILKEGRLAFEEAFRAVEDARRQICAEFYIFRDDETGWGLAELLAKKSREGIRVFLVYDHFGSFTTSNRFWTFLKDQGVMVLPFNPPDFWNPNLYFHRDHRKLILVDDRLAFTGGLNVGDEYRGYLKKKLAGWRDTGVRIEGPVVRAMLEAFKRTWHLCGGGKGVDVFSEVRRESGGGVTLLPLFSSSRRSMRSLRQMLYFSIRSSQRSLYLTMAYFIPTRRFLMALLKAAQRGVDVKILLPGQTDLRVIAYVGRTYYKTLLDGGLRVFHYQPRVLHAKTMVFDGSWSIVGSANFDARSLNYNHECGVGILDRKVAEEMEAMFYQDLQDSQPITARDLSSWPSHERALGRFFSWFRSYL
jgi:cardiolipin synthase